MDIWKDVCGTSVLVGNMSGLVGLFPSQHDLAYLDWDTVKFHQHVHPTISFDVFQRSQEPVVPFPPEPRQPFCDLRESHPG